MSGTERDFRGTELLGVYLEVFWTILFISFRSSQKFPEKLLHKPQIPLFLNTKILLLFGSYVEIVFNYSKNGHTQGKKRILWFIAWPKVQLMYVRRPIEPEFATLQNIWKIIKTWKQNCDKKAQNSREQLHYTKKYKKWLSKSLKKWKTFARTKKKELI